MVLLGAAVIGAILASTPAGRRVRRRLPLASLRPGSAAKEDRDYLLRACDGDPREVERLLDAARARNPEMSEAQAYRRAIRAHLRGKP
jgi:hypothetical protein